MKNKMFNVIFPIWFLIMMPMTWLYVLPANFLVDSIVLLITLYVFKVSDKTKNYKKSILKIWILGFLADIIGGLLLLVSQFIPAKGFLNDVFAAVVWNPFTNAFALCYIFIAVVVSALFIYFFNFKISLKKLDIDTKIKKKIAIILAVFTAPYLFFYPSSLMYKNDAPVVEEKIQTRNKTEYSTYEGDTYITRIFAESENYINSSFVYDSKLDMVTSSLSKEDDMTKVNMYISTDFMDDDLNEYILWAKKCSLIVFIQNDNVRVVNIDLEDSKTGENITKLKFLRNDFEKEYKIKISELKNDPARLEEIINNIK